MPNARVEWTSPTRRKTQYARYVSIYATKKGVGDN